MVNRNALLSLVTSVLVPLFASSCGPKEASPGDIPDNRTGVDLFDVSVLDAPAKDAPITDTSATDGTDTFDPATAEVKSLREMLNGEITEKVRFVVDDRLVDLVDVEALKATVLSKTLREADDFSTLTATKDWWDDYQDEVEILYYSAEHVFSKDSPYPGAKFMPYVWKDVKYRVREVTVEFRDLSEFYAASEPRKRTEVDPSGTTWTLLSANDGMAWAAENFPTAPDEMVILVADNDKYKNEDWSYWFVEEAYAQERGFDAYYFNPPFNEWPTDMQQAEGLTPHDVPIWMHFAFLNGEWDAASTSWKLFPGTRWGGYNGSNVYVVEVGRDVDLPQQSCDPKPDRPASHYYNDEVEYRKCLNFTERIEYDWYRLWRQAFNVPSFPFWWSEKIDIRAVVIDLREYVDGEPEYAEEDVIDWETVKDSVREANPNADITLQKYLYTPPPEIRQVLIDNLIQEASYPLHSKARLLSTDGQWSEYTMDWDYHVDISGLPGMQVYLADQLREYFGGVDENGDPKQYDPFALPYYRTGKPFVLPALFYLTPYKQFEGKIGGWTTNTGELICIFAKQFGFSCEQVNQIMMEKFGQPVGPNLQAWSDAYGLWWEVFIVDWTYTPSPVKTLRWFLDSKPFEELLGSIPEIGPFLVGLAPGLFKQLFGDFHPWASGFPFWLQESFSDDQALALTRQFASFQFAESLQHNIGYKHQTTVIFDSPYLGMEDGFDYIKHRNLSETFDMTAEQISMPFYSTEPGSRDFPIDANSYLTHRMGSGTRNMLQRIFARREVMALYGLLTDIDSTYALDDPDFKEARTAYVEAAHHAVLWGHNDAYNDALTGMEAVDRYWTARGEPDRLFTDWTADATFTPAATGMAITPEELDKALKKIRGQ